MVKKQKHDDVGPRAKVEAAGFGCESTETHKEALHCSRHQTVQQQEGGQPKAALGSRGGGVQLTFAVCFL